MFLDVLHVRRRALLGAYGPRGGWMKTTTEIRPGTETKKAA
jgi:hypothetical protein